MLDAEEHLHFLEMELADLVPEGGSFDDEEDEHAYNDQEAVVFAAEASLGEAKALHAKLKSELAKQKAKVNTMEKNKTYGKTTRDLWMRIERMLRKDFNVYASTYHGGDMEGNHCRRLLREASPIMEEVKRILTDAINSLPTEERKGKERLTLLKLTSSLVALNGCFNIWTCFPITHTSRTEACRTVIWLMPLDVSNWQPNCGSISCPLSP